MLPSDIVTGITSALEDLDVDPAKIADVVTVLRTNSDSIGDSAFMTRMHIATAAFGGSEQGAQLGYHHQKAQLVIEDTLRGVMDDLTRFARAASKAVTMVADADTSSAADLRVKQEAVDLLVGSTRYFEGDRANHDSRNEHLPANPEAGDR